MRGPPRNQRWRAAAFAALALAAVAGIVLLVVLLAQPRYDCDYVIVGGGTAGLIAAYRLSNDPRTKVCVLNVGGVVPPETINNVTNISLAGNLEGNYYAKLFFQNAQEDPYFIANRLSLQLTTGFHLGGGSEINGAQVAYGTDEHFQRLYEETGNPQFLPASVKERLRQIEDLTDSASIPHINRGREGRWKMTELHLNNGVTDFANNWTHYMAQVAGVPEDLEDYNALDAGARVGTFKRWQLHMTADGIRSSSRTAFYSADVQARPNYRMFTNAHVTRLVMGQGMTVRHVEYIQDGRCHSLSVRRGVMMAAGVFTPKVLENSGIGRRSVLEENGVPVRLESDHVGEHLRNHHLVLATFTKPVEQAPSSDIYDIYEGGAWLPTPNPNVFPFTEEDVTSRRLQVIGINIPGPVMALGFINLQPHSEGYAHINHGSSDPLKPVTSRDCVMCDTHDIDRLTAKNLLKVYAKGLHDLGVGYSLLNPTPATIADDSALDDWLFNGGIAPHAHHWTGMCIIGETIAEGVTDSNGLVHGTSNLYVGDINQFRDHVGNTAALAMFNGDRVAENMKTALG